MARDSISPGSGQSKRPSNAPDSDSLGSDQVQHTNANANHHGATQHHKKHSKHHVAGGGRLHARVPSSKALSKHANTAASTTKLHRRITSPSPDRSTSSASALTPSHRRNQSSEVRLSRDPSATNLKKNASQTSLKRNRSHVEISKRSKSAAQLKRSASEKAVHKVKTANKSAVHFDLGQNDDDDDQDEDENEWVDASSSASPYLSRRGSVNTSGPSSAHALGSPAAGLGDGTSDNADDDPTPLAEPNKLLYDDTTQHSRNLTSRLLQRTPSHSATTSMSNTMAVAKASSPESRHSGSTLSVTQMPVEPRGMAGSNGTQEVTSRFITQNSGGSFYSPATGTSSGADRRRLSGAQNPGLSTATTAVRGGDDDDEDDDDDDDDRDGRDGALTDEENTVITSTSAIASTARSKKHPALPTAPPPERSRTQQKINLQRASSSMEPVRHRHSGIGGFAAEVAEVAGPLIGGAGYESSDPRVNKLLERTGVEYNIVRRYQNPVARSLARLAQLPGNDQARRIPRGPTAATTTSHAAVNRHSAHGGSSNMGLSQSFRDSAGGVSVAGARRPETPRRAFSSMRHGGGGMGSSVDSTDEAAVGRLQERLSGVSLVNGEEDEGIQVILRSMWDKNLVHMAASED